VRAVDNDASDMEFDGWIQTCVIIEFLILSTVLAIAELLCDRGNRVVSRTLSDSD
jgi:hypothetical protein